MPPPHALLPPGPLSRALTLLLGLGLLVAAAGCSAPPKRVARPKVEAPPPAPDPDAPLPYPTPQLSAARLLAKDREDAWKPLPPYPPEEATALMTELLTRFAQRAELHRRAAEAEGDKQMSPLQGQNWRDFLLELDELMLRIPSDIFENELLRARKTLETELVADAQVYEEIPSTIVEEVLQRETKFGLRAQQISRSQRRASRVRPWGTDRPGGVDTGSGYFLWPVQPVVVTSLFGRRFHPIHKVYKPHQGLDLQAAMRQDITAAAAGTVLRAGWNGAHGNHVQIKHANGTITGYSHLSKILVKAGAAVTQGQLIGLAGRTGGATGPHLHFELWRNGVAEDPLTELGDPPENIRAEAR